MKLQNQKINDYQFLRDMYRDDYFPNSLVDKGKNILTQLCKQIENEKPTVDTEVYKLTQAATEKFNELNEEFCEQDSEIETAAREDIAESFDFLVKAYGFDLDIEEVIATRDW